MSTEPSQHTVIGGDNDVDDISIDQTQNSQKRRKLTSKVWLDFTKIKQPNERDMAKCNHCKSQFVGESSSGTSHLNKHILSCNVRKNKISGQQLIKTTRNA